MNLLEQLNFGIRAFMVARRIEDIPQPGSAGPDSTLVKLTAPCQGTPDIAPNRALAVPVSWKDAYFAPFVLAPSQHCSSQSQRASIRA